MGQKRKRPEARQEQKETKPSHKGNLDGRDGFKPKKKKIAEVHRPKFIFEPRTEWHTAELPELPSSETPPIPDAHVVDDLHKYADELLDIENSQYEAANKGSSDYKAKSEFISTGTLEDKVSALTLMVQDSPVHNKKAFESLLGLSNKKSRNQALSAIAALKDLLGPGAVLPPDRKLRPFNKQPALATALKGTSMITKTGGVPKLPPGIEKIHLVYWAYEDWLKKQYFELLKTFENWSNDEVEYSRNRSITMVYELLKDKPEQEENLLRLLINKLGDTHKKIASRASYLLLKLQEEHPLMKGILISAIESEYIFRPGQSSYARYNAVVTLNQTNLTAKDQEVSNRLMEIWFKLFVGLIKHPNISRDKAAAQGGGGRPGKKAKQKAKKQEDAAEVQRQADEKMIAQILVGINRAFPYAETDSAAFGGQLDLIYKVTHASNLNTSLQALILLQQISDAKNHSADRFYRTLYESLLDPRLINSSKQTLYLNLLYVSLKNDLNVKRVQAFVKRLLQIITVHEAPFACGAIYLVSELLKIFPSLRRMLNAPEDEDDDGEEVFVDAPEDGEEPKDVAIKEQPRMVYDARKREPQYANAHLSCFWELAPLTNHFHPSVALFASRLLYEKEMPPRPDPTLHTLMHFLDRFSYRNPKANATAAKGSSIFQPLAGSETADRLIKRRSGHLVEKPLNTEAFWAKPSAEVAADEVFFHNYFNQSGNKKTAKTKKEQKRDKKAAENSEDEEDANEQEIWKALVNSKPDIEGEDDDDDVGFDEEDFGSDDNDDAEDGGVELNFDSDDDDAGVEGAAGEDDEDDFDMAELEDGEDAFVDSDEELPSDFDDAVKESADETTPKRTTSKEKREKKRKLKSLPTFASADDYAKMLEGEEEGF